MQSCENGRDEEGSFTLCGTQRFIKETGETELQYHKRLVYGKLVDKSLSEYSYEELSEPVYGRHYNSDVARRMMYGSFKTLQLMDTAPENEMPDDVLSAMEEKRIELQKERIKLADQRAAYNKVIRERARQEELNEILERAIIEAVMPPLDFEFCDKPINSSNDLLVSLNDIHYGLLLADSRS